MGFDIIAISKMLFSGQRQSTTLSAAVRNDIVFAFNQGDT
jgi:hypothetical protein